MLEDAVLRRCEDIQMTKAKLGGMVARFPGTAVWVCMVCACNAQPFDGGSPSDIENNSNSGGSTGDAGAGGGIAVSSAATSGGTGSSSAKLLATIDAPWGLAVDATTVYVARQGDTTPARPLVAIPIAGGQLNLIGAGSNWTVAIDDTRVYWGDGTSIRSCDKQDCVSSTVVLAQTSGSHGIVVDAKNVYWATTAGGAVM